MGNSVNIKVPVICTRGIIVFPGQDVMIEVGREKSIHAVDDSSDNFDSMVWIVCQNDIMVDNPTANDLYQVGTLSKIKIIRRKEGFMRVTFTGMKRARLFSLEDDGYEMMANIETLEETVGNKMEEVTLVKKIISEFQKVSHLSSSFPQDILNQLTKGVSAQTLTDQFAQYFPLDLNIKQKLL